MIRTLVQIGILCALIGAATALTYFFHPGRPSLYLVQELPVQGEISIVEALQKEAAGGVLWVDARQRSQFDKDHVPGALLLNEQEFQALILPVAQAIQENQERPVIVYCDAQKCEASKKMAEELRSVVPDPDLVFVLHGGFKAWQDGRK